MNPIVIAGILAVTISSAFLMISFSDSQVQYANTSEKTSEMQAQRLAEELKVTAQGGNLVLKNASSVPVHIREIRVLDDSGQVTFVQKADHKILASQTITLETSPKVGMAVRSVGAGN